MPLTQKELELLVELKKNPISSMNELAQIIGISPNTVKTRLEQLRDRNILRYEKEIVDPILGKRVASETISYVDPYSIGLERIFVILLDISDFRNLDVIYKYLDKHPYTTYRTMVMGNGINVYIEFQIPQSEEERIERFILLIKSQKLFKSHLYLKPEEFYRSSNQFDKWDRIENFWNTNLYEESDTPSVEAEFHRYRIDVKNNLPKIARVEKQPRLKEFDMKILRELTINAKPSIKYLSKLYNKDQANISRKVQQMRDQYISHYNIAYDKSIFHLGTEFLIYGKMEASSRYAMKMLVIENKIPFLAKYAEDLKYFILRIEAPTYYVNDLVRLIAPYCNEINQLALHKSTNVRYFFYYNNYDFNKHEWRGGDEYIIHEPLRK